MSYHSDFDAHLDNYGSPGPSGGDDERDFEEEAYNRDFIRRDSEPLESLGYDDESK